MTNRVTITLDTDLEKKVRARQAKIITSTGKNYTFSQMITDIIQEAMNKE